MKLFDCHLHIENGLTNYGSELSNANVIFNTVESYLKNNSSYPDFYHSLIFDYRNNFQLVNDAVKSKKIRALKIHSRLQKISQEFFPELINALKKLNADIPIIYDAFLFGEEYQFQPNLNFVIDLATTFPNRKIIVAHAGGYEVLKYFFHLRELKNIGYDLSLSLQYLNDTSCYTDLKKLIKYTPSERIFFGSDFPFASSSIQQNILLSMLNDLKLPATDIQNIFETSWLNFTDYK